MGLFFRKSINLGGGMRLNLGRRGFSFSGGVKGARMSVGSRGVRLSGGRGLFRFQKQIGCGRRSRTRRHTSVPDGGVQSLPYGLRIERGAVYFFGKRHWLKHIDVSADVTRGPTSLKRSWVYTTIAWFVLLASFEGTLLPARGESGPIFSIWCGLFIAIHLLRRRSRPFQFVITTEAGQRLAVRGSESEIQTAHHQLRAACGYASEVPADEPAASGT